MISILLGVFNFYCNFSYNGKLIINISFKVKKAKQVTYSAATKGETKFSLDNDVHIHFSKFLMLLSSVSNHPFTTFGLTVSNCTLSSWNIFIKWSPLKSAIAEIMNLNYNKIQGSTEILENFLGVYTSHGSKYKNINTI